MEVLNKDVASEIELNKQISKVFTGNQEESLAKHDNLPLLGLSGHIARLESRSSFLDGIAAIFTLVIAVWSVEIPKDGKGVALGVIVVFSILLLSALVIKWNVRKRIWVLNRAAEHLKFIVDRA